MPKSKPKHKKHKKPAPVRTEFKKFDLRKWDAASTRPWGYSMLSIPDIGAKNGDPNNEYNIIWFDQNTHSSTYQRFNSADKATDEHFTRMAVVTDAIFRKFTESVNDFEPALSIREKSVDNFDVIDFSDYIEKDCQERDMIAQARDIVNSPDFSFDPSWLWSTNKFFTIVITPSLFYLCKRVAYDQIANAARYQIVEYRAISCGKYTEGISEDMMCTFVGEHYGERCLYVPTVLLEFQAGCVEIDTEECECKDLVSHPSEFLAWSTYAKELKAHADKNLKHDTLFDGVVDGYVSVCGPKFRSISINLLGWRTAFDIMPWMKRYEKLISSKIGVADYRSAHSLLSHTYYNDIYSDFQNVNSDFVERFHVLAAASTVTSALIHVNKRLKDKKLSRPVRQVADSIKHEKQIVLENKPERKTRILDSSIIITSDAKPDTPTMEKIIRYHVPEWGRKSHLRRTKSGKLVEVKSSVCRRKCVDMSDVINKQTSSGTDYIVKGSKGAQE